MTSFSSPSVVTTTAGTNSTPFLSMGKQTFQIPLALFAENRAKVTSTLRQKSSPLSIVYVKGGESQTRYDSDHEPLFRQESYFYYLFGVKEPDCAGVVEVSTGKCVLFVPRLPREYATIMGHIKSLEEWECMYGVDEVRYMDEVESYMEQQLLLLLEKQGGGGVRSESSKKKELEPATRLNGNGNGTSSSTTNGATGSSSSNSPTDVTTTTNSSMDGPKPKLLVMHGQNSDSNKYYTLPTISSTKLRPYLNQTTLFPLLAECRVIKSHQELTILRHVTELTSLAHVYTMRHTKPNMHEYQSESLFRHYCYYNHGCRLVGYTPICGCGPDASILHYGHAGEPNSRLIREGDLCLYDMGAEYMGGYGSDVTCTFPVSGTFTSRQQVVYEGVLNAQRRVLDMLKPGVSWVDCHLAAEEEIVKALVTLGIVTLKETKTVGELVRELRLGAVFMPHGLGHFIGIDTHDVGGYLPGHPVRSTKPGLRSLRTARIMKENMVVTVEPGCYFIDHLLDEVLEDSSNPLHEYLNKEIINEHFRGFGGVRLEDVVAVTKDGCENYTLCPRTVKEVEGVLSGDIKWPPLIDEAPELKRVRLCDTTTMLIAPKPDPPSA